MRVRLTEPTRQAGAPSKGEPEVCPRCGGRGFVEGDKRCPCLFHRMARKAMEPFGCEMPPKEDRKALPVRGETAITRRNAVIEGPWDTVVGPQLRYAVATAMHERYVAAKDYRFRLLTDSEILEASFGGAEGRGRGETPHEMTSGENYDLIVIRLGYIGFKNAAAPGILYELLRGRERLKKPSWVVSEGDAPLASNVAWDARMDRYTSSWLRIAMDGGS